MTKIGGWGESSGFGLKLAELRKAAGLSRQALAEKVGCHQQTLVKLEAKEKPTEPAWPLVLKICDALGVTPNDFREPVSPPSPKPAPAPKRPRGRPRKNA